MAKKQTKKELEQSQDLAVLDQAAEVSSTDAPKIDAYKGKFVDVKMKLFVEVCSKFLLYERGWGTTLFTEAKELEKLGLIKETGYTKSNLEYEPTEKGLAKYRVVAGELLGITF